jgi:putative transposase
MRELASRLSRSFALTSFTHEEIPYCDGFDSSSLPFQQHYLIARTEPTHNRPQRKHPAHGILYVEGQPTIIFDTVCTKDRKPWLANCEVHQLLREVWTDASAWLVGRYMIMPDHIHMFAALTKDEIEFKNWAKYCNSQFSKRYKNRNCRWQADDWDTRMRSGRQYEEKWDYVRFNAVRHKLVTRPEDWPYQGVMNELRWEE